MRAADEIRSELSDLSEVIAGMAPVEAGQPGWLTYESLLDRSADLRMELELAELDHEVEVRLIGGAAGDSEIEAAFLGRFLTEIQATVSSTAQSLVSVSTSTGQLGRDVIGASTMRLVGTRGGSFVLGLDGPRARYAQTSIDSDADDLSPFDDAVGRLLDVFEAAEADIPGDRLRDALAAMGGKRSIGHLAALAKLLSSSGTSTTTHHRDRHFDRTRSTSLSAAAANRLVTTIDRTHIETSTTQVFGKLTGLRWKNNRFDLETGDPETGITVISGTVVRDLREAARTLFDQEVLADVEVTETTGEYGDEPNVTYRLVGLSGATAPRR